jgi:hypothetical protein
MIKIPALSTQRRTTLNDEALHPAAGSMGRRPVSPTR